MSKLNRRDFLALSGGSLIGLTLGGTSLNAMAQEKLSLENASAKALQYVHESEVEGKDCANCMHIQGEVTDWRPCALFPGKLVSNNGWCAGWMAKA